MVAGPCSAWQAFLCRRSSSQTCSGASVFFTPLPLLAHLPPTLEWVLHFQQAELAICLPKQRALFYSHHLWGVGPREPPCQGAADIARICW
jgi:hypothetical protein